MFKLALALVVVLAIALLKVKSARHERAVQAFADLQRHSTECCYPRRPEGPLCQPAWEELQRGAVSAWDAQDQANARALLLECVPPPDVVRAREEQTRLQLERTEAERKLKEDEHAQRSDATSKAQLSRQEAERHPFAASRAAQCDLLPPGQEPTYGPLDFRALAKRPLGERTLALRLFACERLGYAVDLQTMTVAEAQQALCPLPWRVVTDNFEQWACAGASPGPICEVAKAPGDGPCPGRAALEEEVARALREGTAQALRDQLAWLAAQPQTDSTREQRVRAGLRLHYLADPRLPLGPLEPRRAPGSLAAQAQPLPTEAELASLDAKFGPGEPLEKEQRFLRAEVPGEGPVLVVSLCRRFASALDPSWRVNESLLLWTSASRTLSLRPLRRVPGNLCAAPVDVVDLDGDGVPEVLASGSGEVQVWSVAQGGATSRLRYPALEEDVVMGR